MKSNINLYADSKILIDKNFHIDSITGYLETLTKLSLTQLNYIVPKKEMKVKIELSQDFVELGNSGKINYNYAFLWDTINSYFYFIRDFNWISKNVVELDLYMDTINTFTFKNQGDLPQSERDYVITPKTLIHRMHKDRWEFDEELNPPLIPIIDKTSEGIQPALYKRDESAIEASNPYLQQKWYLIYKNENAVDPDAFNQVNPVKILIRPEIDTPVLSAYGTNLQSANFEEGDTFFMSTIGSTRDYCPLRFNCDGSYFYVKEYYGFLSGSAGYIREYVRVRKDTANNIFKVEYRKAKYLTKDAVDPVVTALINQISPTNIIIDFAPYELEAHFETGEHSVPTSMSANKIFYGSGSTITAKSIDELDRTDSTLIKVIELPYCPLQTAILSNSNTRSNVVFKYPVQVDADGNIELDESYFHYTNRRYKLKSEYSIGSALLPYQVFEILDDYQYNRLRSDNPKNISLESKLLSSEFYTSKLVYDSFSLPIKNEYIEFYTTLQRIIFDEGIFLELFTPTTISSKFGFGIKGMYYNLNDEDYDLFLSIARNNEEPIYTSQYINYLRTGFNYDIKAKNQQAMASGVGVGLATLGAVAGVGLGVASNNPAILVSSVVSAITAVTSATTSAINSAITNQRNIEQKLAQAKAQAVSVQSSDDIDLLNAYANNNRAKVCTYKPSEAMLQNIFDLFYYTGYKVEKLGLPDWTSRMRFNYVSADIDLLTTRHLPKDIVDDIKARWSIGITFIHKLTSDITQKNYDFEQELENWEWTLEDALTISQP